MTTSIDKKLIGGILDYKLTLADGTEFFIPVREDGYINATRLCEAGGKRLDNWMRLKETKELIVNRQDADTSHVRDRDGESRIAKANQEIIHVYKGGNNKHHQGTFLHPHLAINLCEWLSVDFRAQVTRWVHELIVTDRVEIGHEKPLDEIHEKMTEDIRGLQQELEEYKGKLSEKEKLLTEAQDIILSHRQNEKTILQRYEKLYVNHQAFLKRKNLYKLREGPCVYLLSFPDVNHEEGEITKLKIGKTSNITERVSGFRTSNPYVQLLFLLYTPNFTLVESFIKTKYDANLSPNNHEFFTGVGLDDLRTSILEFSAMLGSDFLVEKEEELEKFNTHIIRVEDVTENQIQDTRLFRCGGHRHVTEGDRYLTTENFFRNKTTKTGFSRLCKNCILTSVYGENRKIREKTIIPEYDITTHKWCGRCKTVRPLQEFYNDKMSRDGLCPNCKTCKRDQKQLQKQRSKESCPQTS